MPPREDPPAPKALVALLTLAGVGGVLFVVGLLLASVNQNLTDQLQGNEYAADQTFPVVLLLVGAIMCAVGILGSLCVRVEPRRPPPPARPSPPERQDRVR